MTSADMNMRARYFPHAAAGFRSNPFRALTDDEWADCAVVGREIEATYRESESHVQVLGGLGAGKTTTLLGLQRMAQDDGVSAVYEYLAEGQTQFTTGLSTCSLLLLDEAQRLSQSALVRLLRQCGPTTGSARPHALRLVIASHQDLTVEFVQRGLALTSFSVDQLPPASWRTILHARLAAAAFPDQPHATLSDDAVELLIQAFGANRRAAVVFLYEVFQQLRAPITIDAAHLRAAMTSTPER